MSESLKEVIAAARPVREYSQVEQKTTITEKAVYEELYRELYKLM